MQKIRESWRILRGKFCSSPKVTSLMCGQNSGLWEKAYEYLNRELDIANMLSFWIFQPCSKVISVNIIPYFMSALTFRSNLLLSHDSRSTNYPVSAKHSYSAFQLFLYIQRRRSNICEMIHPRSLRLIQIFRLKARWGQQEHSPQQILRLCLLRPV